MCGCHENLEPEVLVKKLALDHPSRLSSLFPIYHHLTRSPSSSFILYYKYILIVLYYATTQGFIPIPPCFLSSSFLYLVGKLLLFILFFFFFYSLFLIPYCSLQLQTDSVRSITTRGFRSSNNLDNLTLLQSQVSGNWIFLLDSW